MGTPACPDMSSIQQSTADDAVTSAQEGSVQEGSDLQRQEHSSPGSMQLSFDCAICHDTLLDPVVGPCGHDMCKVCYDKWCEACSPAGFPACPLCRAPLPRLSVCMRMKRTVEQLLPAAVKRRREEEEEAAVAAQSKLSSRRCSLSCSPRSSMAAQAMQLFGAQPQWSSWTAAAPYGLHSMAAIYSYYNMCSQQQQQQLWWQQQWGAAAQQQSTVTGTPVADAAQYPLAPHSVVDGDQAAQAALPAAPSTTQCSNSSSGTGITLSSGTTAPVTSPQTPRWQSVEDVPIRLSCARAILALLQARCPTAVADEFLGATGNPTPLSLAAVRAVEVALYREAPSKQQYMDPSTLPARVMAFVRRRAAGAARRAAAAASAGPQPTLHGASTPPQRVM